MCACRGGADDGVGGDGSVGGVVVVVVVIGDDDYDGDRLSAIRPIVEGSPHNTDREYHSSAAPARLGSSRGVVLLGRDQLI